MMEVSSDHLDLAGSAEKMPLDRTDSRSSCDSDGGEPGERMRIDSSSSCNSDGLDGLEPLELDDIKRYSSVGHGMRVPKKRFDSICEDEELNIPVCKIFSVAMAAKRKAALANGTLPPNPTLDRAKKNWKNALKLIQERGDPWKKFNLDKLTTENAIRHRYNALTKVWKKENCLVKMDKKPFNHGAMRECFRLKKLSNFSHNMDWDRNSNNYVVKRYMQPVDKETYFDDVRLQMDAKLWGEEYNRHHPPKPVDIFQMAVLEFPEREGQPLFHIEHYIEGNYVKYNSNSGFVDNRACRQTPHAFSHFTFERSGHDLIVVDIQGVGDLYTDPQIHTAMGKDYGDGNLGTKGMALFFHSHSCNSICKSLGLTRFDLTRAEKSELNHIGAHSGSQTILRGHEIMCESPSPDVKFDFRHIFQRNRSNSAVYLDINLANSIKNNNPGVVTRRHRTYSDYSSMEDSPPLSAPLLLPEPIDEDHCLDSNCDSAMSDASYVFMPASSRRRQRQMTECSDDSNTSKDIINFQEVILKKAKPSNVASELGRNFGHDSVLGQIHLDLAKYHEICRFTDDGTYDRDAAFFHLKCSADCGNLLAVIAIAGMYLGMPRDILSDVSAPENENHAEMGFHYMEEAAKLGDRASMVFLARAYDNGANLPDPDLKSARKALDWYENVCKHDEDDGDNSDWGMDDPNYILLARQAEIWLAGAEGVEKDPSYAGDLYSQAAESAMASMNGKLANQYYMLAEEAYGQVEEE
ncbi:hypothetical protein TCAL_01380 [Tigriopus californicus]|uniref:Alpha-type protein kinase domain-containing protein n=1 Tax=Tigriopus californicus TaxID=6832 RepID=A0A553NSR9_TIGCA|nr:eukaryotic elongation factor 2 kinase-like isoform X4 [Tigriopus californicus]TRY68486.1 hypothetical protein TCAL_01380 [Tigriopus californicus]